jgi:hypothetical protein
LVVVPSAGGGGLYNDIEAEDDDDVGNEDEDDEYNEITEAPPVLAPSLPLVPMKNLMPDPPNLSGKLSEIPLSPSPPLPHFLPLSSSLLFQLFYLSIAQGLCQWWF